MLKLSVFTSWLCLAIASRDVMDCSIGRSGQPLPEPIKSGSCFSNCKQNQMISLYNSSITCAEEDNCTVECVYNTQILNTQIVLNVTSQATTNDSNVLNISINEQCIHGHLLIEKDDDLSWSEVGEAIRTGQVNSECKCVACTTTRPPDACDPQQCWSFSCRMMCATVSRTHSRIPTSTGGSSSVPGSRDQDNNTTPLYVPNSSLSPHQTDLSITNPEDSDTTPVLTAVGCVVALVTVIAITISLLWFFRKRRERKKLQSPECLSIKSASRTKEAHVNPSDQICSKPIQVEDHTYNYVDCETTTKTADSQSPVTDGGSSACPLVTGKQIQEYDQVFQGNYTLANSLSIATNTHPPSGRHVDKYMKEEETAHDDNADPADYVVLGASTGETTKKKTEQGSMEDPYDHVRICHGRTSTNGMEDGDYDELQKQHVRHPSPSADNEYDHC